MPGTPAQMAVEVAMFWSTLIQAGLDQEQATQLAQVYVGARITQQTVLSAMARMVADDDGDEPWRPQKGED